MNRVQMIGNLTRKPEIRFTKTGKAVAVFSVALSRGYDNDGKERGADYQNCVAWGDLAEKIADNLDKGSRVYCEGRISTRSYETAEGDKRYVTEVTASIVVPCSYFPSKEGSDKGSKGNGFSQYGKDVTNDNDIPF